VMTFNGQSQSQTGTGYIETGNTLLSGSTPYAWANLSAAYPSAAHLTTWRRKVAIVDNVTVQDTNTWKGQNADAWQYNYPVDYLGGDTNTRPSGNGTRTMQWTKGGKTYQAYIITAGLTWSIPTSSVASGEGNSTNVWYATIAGTSNGADQTLDIAIQWTGQGGVDVTGLSPASIPSSVP